MRMRKEKIWKKKFKKYQMVHLNWSRNWKSFILDFDFEMR